MWRSSMRIEKHKFFSDGITLDGSFYLPDNFNASSKLPLVVSCSGFTGLNSIHPARFSRFFTKHSLICFGFDYRGLGESDGRQGWILIEEQIRDIIHAISFAMSDSRIDTNQVFLLGWGMGAGLILEAARRLKGLKALCSLNGFYNGCRFLRAHRTEKELDQFIDRIEVERRERVVTGKSKFVDPFIMYPMDSITTAYVDSVLRKVPKYELEVCFEFAESLLHFCPEVYAPHLKLPIFIGHGTQNKLHPPEEAELLYKVYSGPKELYWIEGAGHTEWMLDDNPTYKELVSRILDWLQKID